MNATEVRNRAVITQFYALFNGDAFRRHDFSALDTILAPNFTDHNLVPGQGPGIAGLKDAFAGFYHAFPDFGITVMDILAQENKVAVRLEFTGTHGGDFMGVPGTGRTFRVQGMNFIHLNEAGQPTDRWGNADWMGLMQQIGLMPG